MALEFYFDFKNTSIYRAILWEKFWLFRFAGKLKKFFLFLFFIVFLIFLYGPLPQNFSQLTNQRLLGLFIICFSLFLFFWYSDLFFNQKIKKPKLRHTISEALSGSNVYNLAEFLSFEAAKIFKESLRFAKKKKLSQISSLSLLYFALTSKNKIVDFVFSRILVPRKEIERAIKGLLKGQKQGFSSKRINYSPDFQRVLIKGLKIAREKNHPTLGLGDLLTALSQENSFFKEMEVQFDLRAQDIENLVFWAERLEEKKKKKKRFWDYDNLIRRGTLAKAWTAGYTITLDQFSVDITEVIRKKPPEIIGHQEELESLERILSRQEGNNVLLVGEPGSGRKSIVYALAKKSLFGQSLSEVNYKRVVFLNLSKLLAQISSQEEVEFILDTIFQETARAGNVILVIDELHNYISQTSKLGTIDISAIISSYLHLPQFQIIGITTYKGLHTAIEQNFSFVSLFEKVEVSEIKKKETLLLLQRFALDAEEKNKILISYPAIREIVNLSERYFPNLPFPEKAIDILDEVSVAAVQKKKKKIVLPSDVEEIMSEKSQIPIGELKKEEKEKLLNLEKLIHRRIVNQNKAVNEIALAMRRARVDISGRKKPIGGFLFLGPTGVGKTETSKALAEIYFGSEEKMIRLDMSEFQKISDIDRLLGKPGEEGLLTTPVRENPFSLVLLDELEKAHPDILNLFLQILDEGRLTDGQGRKVDFKNTIIIATSNAGYKIILEAIEKNKKWEKLKKEMLDYLFEKGIFRPELINRFDGVVIFRPLTKENLLEIADLMLQRLKRNLKEKGIEFVITLELKEKIVELGYNPIFGAREMKRIIQDKVENALAQAILKGDLKRGQSVEVIPGDFSLKIY